MASKDSRTRIVPRVIGCGIVFLFTSCILPTEICGCVLPPPTFTISGTVTRSSGAPHAAAFVESYVFAVACPATDMSAVTMVPGTATADAQGRFQIYHDMEEGKTDACVRVRVYESAQLRSIPLLSVERTGVRIVKSDSLVLSLVTP